MLPSKFKAIFPIIQQTAKETVKIRATPTTTMPWQSKFMGTPYWEKAKTNDYPKNLENNESMALLAQLNFAEIPKLEGFPQKGIVQFFVSTHDDVYGMNFDEQTEQKNFRVIYWDDPTYNDKDLIDDVEVLGVNVEQWKDIAPIQEEHVLDFEKSVEYCGLVDRYHSEQAYYPKNNQEQSLEQLIGEEGVDELYEIISNSGSKINGYAYFTQDDPRDNTQYPINTDDEYILLLQIDSNTDGTDSILWGDCGVANFFITKKDLINLDFSKVFYNWDCC
jgi:uncharacterized protein YwqG